MKKEKLKRPGSNFRARLVDVSTAETVIEISDKRGAQVTVRLTAHQPVDVIALVDRFLGVRWSRLLPK